MAEPHEDHERLPPSGAGDLRAAPGLYWVLTIAGGGAYAVATDLERRRLTIR
ncbi:hypothetical protein PS467_25175 [Streptomyces luomodiensis]|uniref:Uncharacterized protein n=1 Tax=Streptomyces luomodiensis TaxID=3026192 RepID=A0ABY9V3Z3_9ACTN|nr:hypothetical protein [Streptomyces sp. SCA4-21]WNE98388.1 hypothetical protein PS467_25175 [Streptomyces sp. SCA4-21]